MEIRVLWVDGIEQVWEIQTKKLDEDYYIRDGCIDFTGGMILPHKVKHLDAKKTIVPLSHVRWIETNEDV